MKTQTQKRREDERFVAGKGQYIGDLTRNGLLYLAFVRSPYAHAELGRIDTSAAAVADGVVAVYTGADLLAAGIKPIAGGFPVARADGRPAPVTGRPGLTIDRVRHLGEAVAAVVAATKAQALDAAELVEVDFEPLQAVTGFDGLKRGAPVIWEDSPDNIAFTWTGGDADATAAALKNAVHVTRLDMTISRVSAAPMEPRGLIVEPRADGHLTVIPSHQSPFLLRTGLAAVGFDQNKLTVRIGDVGGSFGMKHGIAPEDVVVAFAARALGRPVMWECTRSEAFLADDQARGVQAIGEIGFDVNGKIVAVRVKEFAELGAYISSKSVWITGNLGGIAGVYDIPAIHVEASGVFATTPQTGAYRGAGRPEATYVIERLMDAGARELGIAPLDLRKRNLIPPTAMPYQTALDFKYDCGEFAANMDKAAMLADFAGFEQRRQNATRQGKLRGIGICNCIELAGGPNKVLAPDIARVSLLADGRLRLHTGSTSVGQGHETVFPQLIADQFGVAIDMIDYHQGNTDHLPFGRGNGGSSGMCVGGSAVEQSSAALVTKLKAIAAERMEVAADVISLEGGIFRSRDANLTMSLADIAASAPADANGVAVAAESTFKPPLPTFPNGTHIAEVEIDPETGVVALISYSAVEDIGRVVHPVLAKGQIQGGVVQGIGQALGEIIVFDGSGQLLSGSFMDYQMPRAADLPSFKLAFNEVLTKANPLGAKGVGEAGTVGAMAATMNAINDALAQAGVKAFDMPATPSRVWNALHAAMKA